MTSSHGRSGPEPRLGVDHLLATLEARYDALQNSAHKHELRGHLRKADRDTHRAAGIAEAIDIVRGIG